MYDDLIHDEVFKRSVLRSLEVKQARQQRIFRPPSGTVSSLFVPWKAMAGMRDRLIHAYFSVDWIIVWDVLTHEIPIQKHLIHVLPEQCCEEKDC